jgi:hypothetical protein
MPGLVPGIYVSAREKQDAYDRDDPGDDGAYVFSVGFSGPS